MDDLRDRHKVPCSSGGEVCNLLKSNCKPEGLIQTSVEVVSLLYPHKFVAAAPIMHASDIILRVNGL